MGPEAVGLWGCLVGVGSRLRAPSMGGSGERPVWQGLGWEWACTLGGSWEAEGSRPKGVGPGPYRALLQAFGWEDLGSRKLLYFPGW